MRHYAKWSAGFVWSPIGTKHFALLANNGSERRPWFNMRGNGGTHYLEDEPDANRQYDQNISSMSFNSNQWYCIEIHVNRVSPGSAIVETWVDGVLRLQYTNANFGTNNWTEILLSGYWNTSPTPGSRGAQAKWYDNIVFSTARIGCLGASATEPSAPSGLRTQ
jgi:hypothetical protein